MFEVQELSNYGEEVREDIKKVGMHQLGSSIYRRKDPQY